MLQKKKSEDSGSQPHPREEAKTQADPSAERQNRNVASIDKKIDDYAVANPKYVDYLNSLSKERLVRKLLYEDLKAFQARQELERGYYQLAVSNPALTEAINEIRAKTSPEQQEQVIADFGRRFAIGTKTRVQRIKAPSPEQTQSGPRASI